MKLREITGAGETAVLRKTRWREAREIKAQLPVFHSQREVGRMLGLSFQRVEQIEMEALYKVIVRMRGVCRE